MTSNRTRTIFAILDSIVTVIVTALIEIEFHFSWGCVKFDLVHIGRMDSRDRPDDLPDYAAAVERPPDYQTVKIATSTLLAAIREARGTERAIAMNLAHDARPGPANQFCLFLKPWTTHSGADLEDILHLVLERAAAHDLVVEQAAVLPGRYVARQALMARHYWRMVGFARTGAAGFTSAIRASFEEMFTCRAEEAVILGGFEMLDRFPAMSPFALEVLWENVPQQRLGNSVTCARVTIDGGDLFLINGFVPNLLATYEIPDNVVTVLSLTGPLPWRDARQSFVGATDPMRAVPGSLRRLLFERRRELGIDIRLGANGVHLSSGPLESLIELRRLLPATGSEECRAITEFRLGRKLIETLGAQATMALLDDPGVVANGRRQELFDLTEEMDEDAVVALLSSGVVQPPLA